ncbi:hypothetical protein WICPIJ_006465 [Wickerhamomyces pijperi]|uniref:Uncharacterized protein n=1 Tax=Wickerhamomyces pijperi TaxID=599730 RepID=A0A9P8Q239_WICPI|nr:hypothetical protein WICPIJ_006465 [Wickerhamomyces pijperi]
MSTSISSAFYERQKRLNSDSTTSSTGSEIYPTQQHQLPHHRSGSPKRYVLNKEPESPPALDFPDKFVFQNDPELESAGIPSASSSSLGHSSSTSMNRSFGFIPSNIMERETLPIFLLKSIMCIITPIFVFLLLVHTLGVPIGFAITTDIMHGIVIMTVLWMDIWITVLYKDVVLVMWPWFNGPVYRTFLMEFTKKRLQVDVNGIGLRKLKYKYNHEMVYKCINLLLDHYGYRLLTYSPFITLAWVLIITAVGVVCFKLCKGDMAVCAQLLWKNKWYVALAVDFMIFYAWMYMKWVSARN